MMLKFRFLVVLALLGSGCVMPDAKVPAAGPRASAWIGAYIEAARAGADEAAAIEFANRYSRSRAAGGEE